MPRYAVDVVVWTLVLAFVATVIITFLAWLRLVRVQHFNKLFAIIIIETAAAGVSLFVKQTSTPGTIIAADPQPIAEVASAQSMRVKGEQSPDDIERTQSELVERKQVMDRAPSNFEVLSIENPDPSLVARDRGAWFLFRQEDLDAIVGTDWDRVEISPEPDGPFRKSKLWRSPRGTGALSMGRYLTGARGGDWRKGDRVYVRVPDGGR